MGCSSFIALGIWQVHRGEQKARLDAQLAAARARVPVDLATLADAMLPAPPRVRAVRAWGSYIPGKQLLLDQQSFGDRSGYDVLTPFRLNRSGGLVLVNRGWRPGDPHHIDVGALEVSDAPREVRGLWRSLVQPGLKLNAHNCRPQSWPRIVFYPDTKDLRCIYGSSVKAGVLLLGSGQPYGFERHWRVGDAFPPVRHYAYAAQWFAFCALALILFYYLNRKTVE